MSKRMHTLTLNRQGEFKILTVGESHCGTMTDQKLPVKYHLVCECEKSLDQRGFLFEQVGIDQFFQNLTRTRLSCERLTMRCVKNIMTLIRKDNPLVVIRSIKLTLSPFPYAANLTYAIEPVPGNALDKRTR